MVLGPKKTYLNDTTNILQSSNDTTNIQFTESPTHPKMQTGQQEWSVLYILNH